MNNRTDITTSSSSTVRRGATGAGASNNDELQQQQIAPPEEDGGRQPQQAMAMIPLAPRPPAFVVSKKPRDKRLHDCFTITLLEEGQGGGVKIVCNYCQDYVKILQKFNPTKARTHLTTQCPGVDEALRKTLLDSTQGVKKTRQSQQSSKGELDSRVASADGAVASPSSAERLMARSSLLASPSAQTTRKEDSSCRRPPSRASLSFHSENAEFLEVTASLQNGDLVLTLTIPAATTNKQLMLNFIAEQNSEGAALCVDGFMNMRPEASWTAYLWYSMAREGSRDGPYCQWSLNYGEYDVDMSRAQRVEQLLKIMSNH